jgi:hypothetical protein
MYGKIANEEIEWFINMYIAYDVSLLLNPLQNVNTCVHVKKTMLFIDFIIKSFPSMIFFFETISNRWELAIFTTIVSCISIKNKINLSKIENCR